MEWIARNLLRIRDDIEAACRRSGRDPLSVRLVCVTKSVDAAMIRAAFALGCRDVGENRIVDAEKKIAQLADLPLVWHGIGTIQTNKAGRAVHLFQLIHSVHAVHTAEALSRAAERAGKRQEVLLQVNASREPQKHGVMPEEVEAVARAVAALPGLHLTGLMTMAALADDPEEARPSFRLLRRLRDRMAAQLPDVVELSMGMSQDYVVAVEEGATLLRIGSAVFAGAGR
ncbi:YggS family pyridoxal phosphate-dependent enzyme [bacterium]|nr:YggS family pyridoxal phosphate-dependent enzyme [bacterium]